MAMNENVIKGKWLEMKGDIQKAWGKLTESELDKTKGDMKAISGLIQQRYGKSQEEHSKKLAEIFERFENKKEDAVKKVKKSLNS